MAMLEEQVLSIEQMQHLKDLGVEVKDTAMCWAVGEISFQDVKLKHQSVLAMDSKPQNYGFIKEIIPTLTIQEILSLLPEKIEAGANYSKYVLNISVGYQCVEYVNGSGGDIWREFFHGNVLQAVYKTLCWVLENGYLDKE